MMSHIWNQYRIICYYDFRKYFFVLMGGKLGLEYCHEGFLIFGNKSKDINFCSLERYFT